MKSVPCRIPLEVRETPPADYQLSQQPAASPAHMSALSARLYQKSEAPPLPLSVTWKCLRLDAGSAGIKSAAPRGGYTPAGTRVKVCHHNVSKEVAHIYVVADTGGQHRCDGRQCRYRSPVAETGCVTSIETVMHAAVINAQAAGAFCSCLTACCGDSCAGCSFAAVGVHDRNTGAYRDDRARWGHWPMRLVVCMWVACFIRECCQRCARHRRSVSNFGLSCFHLYGAPALVLRCPSQSLGDTAPNDSPTFNSDVTHSVP